MKNFRNIKPAILALTVLFLSGVFNYAQAQDNSASSPSALPRGFSNKLTKFTIQYGEQKFPVTPEILQKWEGSSSWSERSMLERQPQSLDIGFKKFMGTKTSKPKIPSKTYPYRIDKIYQFVSQTAESINATPTEPSLIIENGRASEFTPPSPGLRVDNLKTTLDILLALGKKQEVSDLVVNETYPKKFLSQTNSLGITELVAEGVSGFKGSPNNRRHNIKIGIEKMKGVIIAPGEVFSFNKFLGEVDGENGFLPELVIKRTGTVPEFGGGLCQVSSTTFRAAMNAGLPIVERRNHAYAVQYYAPQGTDATIYPGIVDLRFTNDTPGHLLIWPFLKDKDTVVFQFYGTKDSRQVVVDKPVQYDRKEDGSMKATWSRTVIKNGKESKDVFKSVYQSPALYHKTETFVTSPAPATPQELAN